VATRQDKEAQQKNSASARVFPPSGDHRALAAYWGAESARCLLAVVSGASAFPILDAEHAWRTARIAAFHGLKCGRGV
jgi:hypothetical protein